MQSVSCELPERRGKNRTLTVCLGAQRPMQRYSIAQKKDCTVHRNDKIRMDNLTHCQHVAKRKNTTGKTLFSPGLPFQYSCEALKAPTCYGHQ